MDKKINLNNIALVVLSALAVLLPFRSLLSEYVFSGFKVLPDVIVFAFLVVLLFRKKLKITFDMVDYAYLAFLLFAFVSTIFINNEGIVRFIMQIRSICLYYVLYFVLKNSDLHDQIYIKFSKIVSILVYIVVGLAVIEVVSNKECLFPHEWVENIIYFDNFIRAYSIFDNPNTFAAFLIFAFIFRYQVSKDFWIKEHMPFIIVCLLGILISVSRSTIILLIIFLVLRFFVYLYVCKKNKMGFKVNKFIILPILLSFVCWGAVDASNTLYLNMTSSEQNESGALDRFGHMFENDIVKESQTDGRLYNVKKGFEIFKDYKWFGTGFGTYGSSASLTKESKLVSKYDLVVDLYSDNEYIVILVETGIIGTALFVLFIASIFWKYRKSLFKLTACIVFAGLGMFYNVLEVQILAFLFWICLAAPCIIERRETFISEK